MNDTVTSAPSNCPECGNSAIAYKNKAALWECQACEARFAGSAPAPTKRRLDDRAARPKAIFFSYGHDDNKKLVKLFKADLEKRGHQVWFDEKGIGIWDDWKGKITRGIDASQLAIAFMSRHSIRDPGVCRNEIAIAMNRFGEVYPILLEAGIEQDIPVTIRNLQWPDLSKWKEIRDGKVLGVDWDRWYEEKLLNLIEKIEGDATRFADETRVLGVALQPARFVTKITQHVPGFIGREWLFDAYHQWVDHQPESRLFWVKAGPGVGKSAIAANLAHRERAAIAASWFCDAKSPVLKDPDSALKSIAFQLALRLEDYRVKLLRALQLYASATDDTCEEVRKELAKKNTQDLFRTLIAEPMAGLIWREHKVVVVIDALDEATDEQGNNRIAELISGELSSLPEWIGFVVTSRPEAEVVNRLGGFKPFAIDAEDPRNVADLRLWYAAHLGRRPELSALPDAEQQRLENLLIKRSGGMILYLKVVEEGFKEGSLTVSGVEQLESGLLGLYARYLSSFQQRFGSDYAEAVKPLLRLLLAAGGPLPEDLACEVLGWNSEQFLACRNRIGSYAIETAEGYELFHKTLGEWLIDKSSGPFHLDRALGRQMIADVLFKEVADKESHLIRWRKSIQEWLPEWLPQLTQYESSTSLSSLARFFNSTEETVSSTPRTICERAIAILERTLDPNQLNTAEALDTLVRALVKAEVIDCDPDYTPKEGDSTLTELLLRRSLKIRQDSLGTAHAEVGGNLYSLASRLYDTGCYADAEPLLQRSLAICENSPRSDASNLAFGHHLFAKTKEKLGNIAGAELHYRRALAITDKASRAWATFNRDAARFLCKIGNHLEAESLFREAVANAEAKWPEGHTAIAARLFDLVDLLIVIGRYDEAVTYCRKALDIRERNFGPDNEDTMLVMQNLAVSLRNAGRLEEAESLQREAMARFVRVYGEESLEAATTYSAMGALLKLKEELAEAESYYVKALAIRERELGRNDEKTLLIRQRLECLKTAGPVFDTASPQSKR